MKTIAYLTILITLPIAVFTSCNKEKHKKSVLKELFHLYEDGQISECLLDGRTVFAGSINANDAPTILYDEEGYEIGTCDYAWGSVDAICYELTDCATIYCVEDNIWGQPAVDTYDLKP